MLSRGMQRSTYTSQLLAGINNEAAEAQGEIDAAQTKATNDLNDQRTQLAAQLAAQMNQYTASQQSDILKRIAELEEQDRQYSLSQTSLQQSLATDLYALLKQKEDADAVAAAAAKKPSGGVYTPPTPTGNDVGDDKQKNDYDLFIDQLGGTDSIKTVSAAVKKGTTLVGNHLKKPIYAVNWRGCDWFDL